MRGRIAIGAGLLLGAALIAIPAWADSGSTTASDGGSTVSVGAANSSTPSGPKPHPIRGGAGGSTSSCHYTPFPAQDAADFGPGGPGPGEWFFVSCPGEDLTIFTGVLRWIPSGATPTNAPAGVSAGALANEARDSLTLPSPVIAVNPAPFSVVNFPTWLWIDPGEWRTYTATAAAGGVVATATATPQSVTWTTGDGHDVACDGPGTAYQPGVPFASQSTDCSYTYTSSSIGQPSSDRDPNDGAYPLTATISWAVSWSASGSPGGGQLAPLFTTSTVPVRVEQVESVATAR